MIALENTPFLRKQRIAEKINKGENCDEKIAELASELGMDGEKLRQEISDRAERLKPQQKTKDHDGPDELFDPFAEYQVPAFPVEILPEHIQRYVKNASKSMGCDMSAFAMCALGALSGAISTKFSVAPMATGEWIEHPNLWIALIGSPGMKKSPMMSAAKAPLEDIHAARQRTYDQNYDTWRKAQRASAAQKGKKKPDGAVEADDGWSDEPQPPASLLANDLTYEKLVRNMAHSPNGILATYDELAGLIGGFGNYSRGGSKDRSFYLQAWTGGYYCFERVTGGEDGKGLRIGIENCALSILGGIQMDRLRKFTDVVEDGLLQRFLPVIITHSDLPQEIDVDERGDSGQADYAALVNRCLSAQPLKVLLTEEAREVFNALRRELHDLQLASSGMARGFSEFISKLSGYSVRLALVLHIIENPEGAARLLSEKTARDAARLVMDFILEHGLACYRTLEEITAQGDRLEKVASYLLTARDKNGELKQAFVPSDFTNNCPFARNMDLIQLDKLLGPFVAAGWLHESEKIKMTYGRGKTAKMKWTLEPEVRVQFANRQADEERRKGKVAKLMNAQRRRGEMQEEGDF